MKRICIADIHSTEISVTTDANECDRSPFRPGARNSTGTLFQI